MLKLRCLTSQLCACFPYNCLTFTLGTAIGFNILLIAELHDQNSKLPATINELSWFASLDGLKFIGSIITGLLMHHLGCRSVAFIIAMMFIISYLIYYSASNVAMVMTARFLTSLTSTVVVCSSFISETCEVRLRGRFLSMTYLYMTLGTLFTSILATFVFWRHIALINLAFPTLTILTVFATPNSPSWLASNGRSEEAEKALCWLRGWVKPEQVENEFEALMELVQQSKSNADKEAFDLSERLRKLYKFFMQRSFYLPLGTLCVIFLVFVLSGGEMTFTYSRIIFQEINSPIEESLATAIMGAAIVVGQLILVLTIDRFGKRVLIMWLVVVSGLCLATTTTIGFLQLKGIFSWIAPITIIIVTFVNYSGVESILLMLIVEIFPSRVRYIGSAFALAVFLIFEAIMSKLFLYIVEAVTMNGLFMLFALMNIVSIVTYYFLFPETEGKSLEDIESRYNDVE